MFFPLQVLRLLIWGLSCSPSPIPHRRSDGDASASIFEKVSIKALSKCEFCLNLKKRIFKSNLYIQVLLVFKMFGLLTCTVCIKVLPWLLHLAWQYWHIDLTILLHQNRWLFFQVFLLFIVRGSVVDKICWAFPSSLNIYKIKKKLRIQSFLLFKLLLEYIAYAYL